MIPPSRIKPHSPELICRESMAFSINLQPMRGTAITLADLSPPDGSARFGEKSQGLYKALLRVRIKEMDDIGRMHIVKLASEMRETGVKVGTKNICQDEADTKALLRLVEKRKADIIEFYLLACNISTELLARI